MPMTAQELAELSTLIAAARKKPINYGLCIGKKPDTTILYLHRKKTPDILMRLAKKAGDTAKTAMGTVTVSGKRMVFTVDGDPPSGMDKRVKLFLTANKTPFIVEVLGAAGDEAVADNGGGEDAAGNAGPPPVSQADIDGFKDAYAQATQRLKDLKKLKVNLSDIQATLDTAKQLADDEKYVDALAMVSGLAPKFEAAEKEYCDRKKAEARAAIDLTAAYQGVALDIPKLESQFAELETECTLSPINSKEIIGMVKAIVRRQKQLRKISKKFKREHDKVLAYIKEWCEDYLNDVGGKFEASVKLGFENDIIAVKKKLDEHSAKLAKKMATKVFCDIYDEKEILKDAETYQTLKIGVETKLATIYAKRAQGLEEDCKRLEGQEKRALDFEKARAFYDATLIMTEIDGEIADLQTFAGDYKFYLTALRKFQTQLVEISRSPQYEFVIPEFKALMVGLKAIQALADKKELDKATNKAIDLLASAEALEAKASKAAPLTEFEDGIDNDDIEDLRQQAKDILKDLRSHPRAKLAPFLLAEVAEHVEALDSLWNQWIESSARAEMKVISKLANEARVKLDSVDVFYGRAVTLGANTSQFGKSHPQALYVRPIMATIATIVTKAKADALASLPGIAAALTEGERLLELAKTTADAEVAYRTHRTTTEASVTAISEPAVEFEGKEKILADINTQMVAAEAFSKGFKHEDAEKALGKVDTLVMTANIGTSAKSGTPPDKADIEKLLAQPDGQKALDDLVASLPDSTQQDVMINVLEVRFGMEVNVFANVSKLDADKEKKGRKLDVPAPKLLEYYEALKSVPASHTNLNPSLLQFDSVEEDKGGYFSPSKKRVVIELDKKADDKMGDRIGKPEELDDIDPDSVAPEGVEDPTLGSWVTYHEIGHAVDDRQSYMDGKLKDPDFGGWVEYGSNIAPIAVIAAAHFEFDLSYVERTLAGGKPKTPKVPPELLEKEGNNANKIWSKRKKNFKAWRKAISVKSKPWKNAGTVNTHKINGVMYQEAYSNNWVSYIADARKKGVTGYQFRAPGEWFAELYAAFYTKKLNTSHPANTWLAGL